VTSGAECPRRSKGTRRGAEEERLPEKGGEQQA
jgi:hypothetical protein